MDKNKNSCIKAISVYLSNVFFVCVFSFNKTKHSCLLNLNIIFATKQSTKIDPTPSQGTLQT